MLLQLPEVAVKHTSVVHDPPRTVGASHPARRCLLATWLFAGNLAVCWQPGCLLATWLFAGNLAVASSTLHEMQHACVNSSIKR
jgi:hypothetical protein